jgi:hypothetical protein
MELDLLLQEIEVRMVTPQTCSWASVGISFEIMMQAVETTLPCCITTRWTAFVGIATTSGISTI